MYADICDRCGNATKIHTISMFNTQSICMDCRKSERARPDYRKACEADRFAIMNGNWNFEGIGLDNTDKEIIYGNGEPTL